MKAFFIRQILPPVLVQLSIIVVLVYFEAKDFVPYVSPDEAGGGFSGGIGAGAERAADMAVAGRGSSTLFVEINSVVYTFGFCLKTRLSSYSALSRMSIDTGNPLCS